MSRESEEDKDTSRCKQEEESGRLKSKSNNSNKIMIFNTKEKK
jgi:hypothetical protein